MSSTPAAPRAEESFDPLADEETDARIGRLTSRVADLVTARTSATVALETAESERADALRDGIPGPTVADLRGLVQAVADAEAELHDANVALRSAEEERRNDLRRQFHGHRYL